MRKLLITLIIIVVLLILFLSVIILLFLGIIGSGTESDSSSPVIVTKENLPSFLENQEIVKSMPDKGRIIINFDEQNGSKLSYFIDGKVVTQVSNYDANRIDAEISLPSSYIPELGYGLCSAIQKAQKNGELIISTKLSKSDFAWKYMKLLKYKNCLDG